MCHCMQLIFVFLIEMGFHHVGQTGHELLSSGDRPASASQRTGIAGMSHHAQLVIWFLYDFFGSTRGQGYLHFALWLRIQFRLW